MASHNTTGKLVRLSDTDLMVADPAEDIRGRQVVDKDGEQIGEVDDLFLDEHETKIRFLEVASGGFLGLGETKFLVPVEAITRLTDDTIYINETRQHVAGTPPYDPDLINQEVGEGSYYGNVYRHYGYPPYWGPDYVYPPYPHYRPRV